MSRACLALLMPCALLGAQAPKLAVLPEGAPAAMAEIRAGALLEHARFLAGDELRGRLTGTPGQERAAEYIADCFRELGLEPLGDETAKEDGTAVRSFFQTYPVTRTWLDAERSRVVLGGVKAEGGYALLGGQQMEFEFEGTLRFVGLGRTRGSRAEIGEDESLEKTLPLLVLRPPRGRIGSALSIEQKFGMGFMALGNLNRGVQALAKKGAPAVAVALPEDPFGLCDVLNMLGLAPGKDVLEARFASGGPSMGMLSSVLAGNAGVPVVVLAPALSAKAFAELGLESEALATWLSQGEGKLPEAKTGVPARLVLHVRHDAEARARNVVAVLRGSDPRLQGEAVVYSAHMDHVGVRMDGEVYNGADDNASGTAGLLGIAAAFARSEVRPARSVIFLSVSGEELGLWGSAYFADHPTWPLADIVANVNTDMIGRSGPESGPREVTVTPSHRHEMFSTIVQDSARFAERLGLTFADGDKYYLRSDHYNFVKKGIPAVFFCNGEHEDYHQVTDTADKLDGDKMERIAALAFWTGWQVANAEERPRTLGRREDWK